jgi:hypothetical protein
LDIYPGVDVGVLGKDLELELTLVQDTFSPTESEFLQKSVTMAALEFH